MPSRNELQAGRRGRARFSHLARARLPASCRRGPPAGQPQSDSTEAAAAAAVGRMPNHAHSEWAARTARNLSPRRCATQAAAHTMRCSVRLSCICSTPTRVANSGPSSSRQLVASCSTCSAAAEAAEREADGMVGSSSASAAAGRAGWLGLAARTAAGATAARTGRQRQQGGCLCVIQRDICLRTQHRALPLHGMAVVFVLQE